MRFEVQDRACHASGGEQVGDEQQVGDEFTARVVGDEAEAGSAARRQEGPQGVAVVGEERRGGGLLVPVGAAFRRQPEAEVGAVAPQGAVQQGAVPVVGREVVEGVERGEFLVRLGGVEFGELGGPERVDALPGSGGEPADGFEEQAVEVALREQPGHLEPGAAGVLGEAPGLPVGEVGGVAGQRFDRAAGAVVQQSVQCAADVGAVGEGVLDLADDRGVPFGEDAVREGAGGRLRRARGAAAGLSGMGVNLPPCGSVRSAHTAAAAMTSRSSRVMRVM
ncbi:hypothetical protein GCM10020256_14210 [Streptomyces thermocoprophilus]